MTTDYCKTQSKINISSTYTLTKLPVWEVANPQNLSPGSPGPEMTNFIKRSVNKIVTKLTVCQNLENRLSTVVIRNEQTHDNKRSGRYYFFEGRLHQNIVFWYLSEWISNVNNVKILKDVSSGMARNRSMFDDHATTTNLDFWRTSAAKCLVVMFDVSLSSDLEIMIFDRRPQRNHRLLGIPDTQFDDQARANGSSQMQPNHCKNQPTSAVKQLSLESKSDETIVKNNKKRYRKASKCWFC